MKIIKYKFLQCKPPYHWPNDSFNKWYFLYEDNNLSFVTHFHDNKYSCRSWNTKAFDKQLKDIYTIKEVIIYKKGDKNEAK